MEKDLMSERAEDFAASLHYVDPAFVANINVAIAREDLDALSATARNNVNKYLEMLSKPEIGLSKHSEGRMVRPPIVIPNEDQSDLQDSNILGIQEEQSDLEEELKENSENQEISTQITLSHESETSSNIDGSSWELRCTKQFLKDLSKFYSLCKYSGYDPQKTIFKKLHELASGPFQNKRSFKALQGSPAGTTVFESRMSSNTKLRMYWQIIRAYSFKESHYTDMILLWRIDFKHKQSLFLKRLAADSCRSLNHKFAIHLVSATVPGVEISSDSVDHRQVYKKIEGYEPCQEGIIAHYPVIKGADKLFSLDDNAVRKFFLASLDGLVPELPFLHDEYQAALTGLGVSKKDLRPMLLKGRSGTGKTSIAVARMFTLRQQAAKDYSQVFVTSNDVLRDQVRKLFLSYSLEHSDDCNVISPVFLTRREWLCMLDQTLEHPFGFNQNAGKAPWFDSAQDSMTLTVDRGDDRVDELSVQQWFSEGESKSFPKEKLKVEFDFARFLSFWKKMERGFRDKWKEKVISLNPTVVFREIQSYIKGSYEASNEARGHLSKEMYLTNERIRRASHFGRSAQESEDVIRELMYEIFLLYEDEKKRQNGFDTADLVFKILSQVREKGYSGTPIDSIYVDEVQDFSQAELRLFIEICNNKNDLFFAGDTAQTIANGIGFRFKDLTTLMYDLQQKQTLPAADNSWRKIDERQLRVNYRTHSGILDTAATVLDILNCFFQDSIDKMDREEAIYIEESWFSKPLLLQNPKQDMRVLANFFIGQTKTNKKIDFGASQAVIVRDESSKLAFRENAPDFEGCLVLTVLESKGLEFDDVIVWNFFADSTVDKEWRIILRFWLDEIDSASERESRRRKLLDDSASYGGRLRDLEFNYLEHHVLCSELKHLYVTLTRARRRIIFFDGESGNETQWEKRIPMYYVLEQLQKAKMITSDDLETLMHLSRESESTPLSTDGEWRVKGKQFKDHMLFEQAAMCFSKCGDIKQEWECKALGLCECVDSVSEKRVLLVKAGILLLAAAQVGTSEEMSTTLTAADDELRLVSHSADCFHSSGFYMVAGDLYEGLLQRGNRSLQHLLSAVTSFCEAGLFQRACALLKTSEEQRHAASILKRYVNNPEAVESMQGFQIGLNLFSDFPWMNYGGLVLDIVSKTISRKGKRAEILGMPLKAARLYYDNRNYLEAANLFCTQSNQQVDDSCQIILLRKAVHCFQKVGEKAEGFALIVQSRVGEILRSNLRNFVRNLLNLRRGSVRTQNSNPSTMDSASFLPEVICRLIRLDWLENDVLSSLLFFLRSGCYLSDKITCEGVSAAIHVINQRATVELQVDAYNVLHKLLDAAHVRSMRDEALEKCLTLLSAVPTQSPEEITTICKTSALLLARGAKLCDLSAQQHLIFLQDRLEKWMSLAKFEQSDLDAFIQCMNEMKSKYFGSTQVQGILACMLAVLQDVASVNRQTAPILFTWSKDEIVKDPGITEALLKLHETMFDRESTLRSVKNFCLSIKDQFASTTSDHQLVQKIACHAFSGLLTAKSIKHLDPKVMMSYIQDLSPKYIAPHYTSIIQILVDNANLHPRYVAAGLRQLCAAEEEYRQKYVGYRVVGALLRLLTLLEDDSDSQVKEDAEYALKHLAAGFNSNKLEFMQEDIVSKLKQYWTNGNARQKIWVTLMLRNLSEGGDDVVTALLSQDACCLLSDIIKKCLLSIENCRSLKLKQTEHIHKQQENACIALKNCAECNDIIKFLLIEAKVAELASTLFLCKIESQQKLGSIILQTLALGNDDVKRRLLFVPIEPFLAMAKQGNEVQQEHASKILAFAACSPATHSSLIASGVCRLLLRLVASNSGSQQLKMNALVAVESLALGSDLAKELLVKANAIVELTKVMMDGTEEEQLHACSGLKGLTAGGDDVRMAVVQSGAVAVLIKRAGEGQTAIQEQAVGALQNLIDGQLAIRRSLVNEGVVELLLQFCQSNLEMKAWSLSAVRDLAAEDNEMKTILCEAGALELLLKVANTDPGNRLTACTALVKVSQGYGKPHDRLVGADAIKFFLKLSKNDSAELRTLATEALSGLAAGCHSTKAAMVDNDAVNELAKTFKRGIKGQQFFAISALRHLAEGIRQFSNAFDKAIPLLLDNSVEKFSHEIRSILAATLRYLAAENESTQLSSAKGSVEVLVRLAEAGTFEGREHSILALCYLAQSNDQTKDLIVSARAVPIFMRALEDELRSVWIQEIQEDTSLDEAMISRLAKISMEILMILAAGSQKTKSALVKCGLVAILKKITEIGSTPLRNLANKGLYNLAVGDSTIKKELIRGGVIKSLVSMHSEGDSHEREHAALGLVMASSNLDLRRLLFSEGAIKVLTSSASSAASASKKLQQYISALGNLAVGTDELAMKVKRSIADSHMVDLLVHEAMNSKCSQALAVLESLAEGDNCVKDKLAVSGAVTCFVQATESGSSHARLKAIITMKCMALGTIKTKDALLKCGAIEIWMKFVREGSIEEREKAVEGLQEIASDAHKIKMALAAAGAVVPMIKTISEKSSSLASKIAAMAVLEEVSKDQVGVDLLLKNEAIKHLVILHQCGPLEQIKAANAVLQNLVFADDKTKQALIDANAIQPIINILQDSSAYMSMKLHAIAALEIASRDAEKRSLINEAAVKPLITFVLTASESNVHTERATVVIQNMAKGPAAIKRALVQAGGVCLMVEMATTGAEEEQEHAVEVLCLAACNRVAHAQLIASGAIPLLMILVASDRGSQQLKMNALVAVENLALGGDFAKELLVKANAIAELTKVMMDGTEEEQLHACSAMKGLAAGGDDVRMAVVQSGAVAVLMKRAGEGQTAIQEQAVDAVLLLAKGGKTIKKELLQAGVVTMLISRIQELLQKEYKTLFLVGGNAIVTGLIRAAQYNGIKGVISQIDAKDILFTLPSAAQIRVKPQNLIPCVEGSRDCHGVSPQLPLLPLAAALSDIADGEDEIKAGLVSAGVVDIFLKVIRAGSQVVQQLAMVGIKNLATGSSEIKKLLVEKHVVEGVITMCDTSAESVKMDSIIALKELAAGGHDCQVSLVGSGAIPLLLKSFHRGDPTTSYHARVTLQRLAAGSDEIKKAMIAAGAISPIVAMLQEESDDALKTHSVIALEMASRDDAGRAYLVKDAAVKPLLGLVRAGSSWQKERATAVIQNMAKGPAAIKRALVQAGGVDVMVAMATTGAEAEQEHAVEVLCLAAWNSDAHAQLIASGAIPLLMILVASDRGSQRLKMNALVAVENLALGGDFAKELLVKANAIAELTKVMMDGTKEEQRHACSAMKGLAAGGDDVRMAVVQSGAVAVLMKRAGEGQTAIQEQAVDAVLLLAKGGKTIKKELLQAGVVTMLISRIQELLQKEYKTLFLVGGNAIVTGLIRAAQYNGIKGVISQIDAKDILFTLPSAAQIRVKPQNLIPCVEGSRDCHGVSPQLPLLPLAAALSDIADGEDEIKAGLVSAGVVDIFLKVIRAGSQVVQQLAMVGIKNLATGSSEIKKLLVEKHVVEGVITMCDTSAESVKMDSIIALKELAAGGHDCQVSLVGSGAIPLLLKSFHRGDPTTSYHARVTLQRLAAGSDEIKKAMIAAGAISPIVAMLQEESDDALKTHAVIALEMASRDDAGRAYLVKDAAVKPLLGLVRAGSSWQKERATAVIQNMAKGPAAIKRALVQAGGVDVMVAMATTGAEAEQEHAVEVLCLAAWNSDAHAQLIASGALLLLTSKATVMDNALIAVEKLALCDDALKQHLVDSKAVPELTKVLMESMREEQHLRALCGMKGLAAGGDIVKMALLKSGALVSIVKVACNGPSELQDTALGIILLLAKGGHTIKEELLRAGVIPVLDYKAQEWLNQAHLGSLDDRLQEWQTLSESHLSRTYSFVRPSSNRLSLLDADSVFILRLVEAIKNLIPANAETWAGFLSPGVLELMVKVTKRGLQTILLQQLGWL